MYEEKLCAERRRPRGRRRRAIFESPLMSAAGNTVMNCGHMSDSAIPGKVKKFRLGNTDILHTRKVSKPFKTSVRMLRQSYPTETVLSNKTTRNRIVLSFSDSPRKSLGRRPIINTFASRRTVDDFRISRIALFCAAEVNERS